MTDIHEGGEFSYHKDAQGHWWRRQMAWRCTNEVPHVGQCQGVSGHEGRCWAFNKAGWFCWMDTHFSGMTPPNHQQYRDPVEMTEHHYLSHISDEFQITDPDEIARLEAGDLEPGESTTKPV